jgi:ArsR family transcriptional regulator
MDQTREPTQDLLWKALSDPLRRKILEHLSQPQYFCQKQGKTMDGICVQDLAGYLRVPQSTISRHLAILTHANWVVQDRWKTWHYYRVNPTAMVHACAWMHSLNPSAVSIPPTDSPLESQQSSPDAEADSVK